jgi:hypothetical protein
MRPIRTILIDNYDSYTYNLYQQIAVINGGWPSYIVDALFLALRLCYHLILQCGEYSRYAGLTIALVLQ